MAAGLGFKDFVTGEVLTAADVDGYLMQGIWVFADDAARTAAVASPQEGNMSFLKDTNSTEYYSGSAWVAVGAAGGGMTLLSTTTLSGATTNITTISQDYLHLQMIIEGLTLSATDDCLIKFNTSTAPNLSGVNSGTAFTKATGEFIPSGNASISVVSYTIFNYSSTTGHKAILGASRGTSTNSNFFGGLIATNTEITAINFSAGGAVTYTGGTVRLYGVK
jgi:hypothetical protein